MKKVLFVCSRNKLRSPTAEAIFSNYENLEVASAGLDDDAVVRVTPELVEWADVIYVMGKNHKNRLQKKFKKYLNKQRVVCLGISDNYDYMDPELIKLLKMKLSKILC